MASEARAMERVLDRMLAGLPTAAHTESAPFTEEQAAQLAELMAGIDDYRNYRRRTRDWLETRAPRTNLRHKPARRELVLRRPANAQHTGHALSPTEQVSFAKSGLAGPFAVLSRDEAADMRRYVLDRQQADFGGRTVFSDEIRAVFKRHGAWGLNAAGLYHSLFDARLWDLYCRPEITDRLETILGADLLCWRTQIFEAVPASMGTFWHQASKFREQADAPKLEPTLPIDDAMTQLTVWIALEDVSIENSCLRFLAGSFCDGRFESFMYDMFDRLIDHVQDLPETEQRRVLRAMLFQTSIFKKAEVAFHEAVRIEPDLFEDYELVDMKMSAGEAIIFTSMNIHASYPNRTNRSRIALAGRYTTNDVKVLNGITTESLSTPEGVMAWPLDRVGCMQVRGVDRFGFNRILPDASPHFCQ